MANTALSIRAVKGDSNDEASSNAVTFMNGVSEVAIFMGSLTFDECQVDDPT